MDEFLKQLLPLLSSAILPTFFPYLTQITPTPLPTPTPTIVITATPTITPTLVPTKTPTPTINPTPTNIPTPTLPPVTSTQLDEWFTTYSATFSVDRQKLWQIAVCESNLRPHAKNGDYGEMYQFSTGTWKSTRQRMNLDSNPELRFNPEEAIKSAAFLLSTRGHSPWPNCSN